MQPLGRREFLQRSAGTTVALGFPFLTRWAAGADLDQAIGQRTVPDLLPLARERMKQEVKPGVVVLIPAEREAAVALADDLALLIGGNHPACSTRPRLDRPRYFPEPVGAGDPDAHRLFCQAVFVCLPPGQAHRAFPNLKPTTAVVLMDADGKPIEELASFPTLFGKDFVPRMTELLHGKKGERLAALAQAQRHALGKELCECFDRAVRDLDANDFATRDRASKQLAELAPRATALLAVQLQDRPPLEMRRRIERLFDELYRTAPAGKPSPRLPYGVEWREEPFDPCPFCGLSATPQPTRVFLRFLTEVKQ